MQITRHGSYGILIKDSQILLTQKKSGAYAGLWGLPGGTIEFGETPSETLRRELLEEAALTAGPLQFLNIATATGNYTHNGEPYGFHQVGTIYKVQSWEDRPDRQPEEAKRWVYIDEIVQDELTPFAKYAVINLILKSTWRPPQTIRGKVIALIKRNNQLLVCEVKDDTGQLKGYCPPGGGIEFGEFAEGAVRREMLEELGCSIQIQGAPLVFENLYEHHEAKGHDIIFAFPARLDDPSFYTKERFQITEDNGSLHWMQWIDSEDFKAGKLKLFPEKLRFCL